MPSPILVVGSIDARVGPCSTSRDFGGGRRYEKSVRAFFSILAALLLLTSLGFSTLAHARDSIGCAAMTPSATMPIEADCSMVAVPADADRGYPHHHTVCHGDQIAAFDDEAKVPAWSGKAERLAAGRTSSLAAAASRVALEPPQA